LLLNKPEETPLRTPPILIAKLNVKLIVTGCCGHRRYKKTFNSAGIFLKDESSRDN